MIYVTNEDLLRELKILKDTKIMSEELGAMILKIARQYSNKGNFGGYTWKDDMVGDAVLTCVRYINKFDPERGSNPFAYITTICKNSFINFIKKQQKHSKIKDKCFKSKDQFTESNKDSVSGPSDMSGINYSSVIISDVEDPDCPF